MASNTFGNHFKITTWGESHGKAIGVVIDGCPAGIDLSELEINKALQQRAPGYRPGSSPRSEPDIAEIYSGVFAGKTTGAPISIIIENRDFDTSKYEPIKDLIRPGHANYTYLAKYGYFDYRGGGRSSARETACRVAASAVAEKIIPEIMIQARIKAIGNIVADEFNSEHISEIFCQDPIAEKKILAMFADMPSDSFGGVVECVASNMTIGLGDPIFEKLEANLAKAMLSIPASKGFEIGAGFSAAKMLGSKHNDLVTSSGIMSNNAGGTLAGITNGEDVVFRVAFKPTSSINKPQRTVTINGNDAVFNLPKGSRHDQCLSIRAVPVVRAMCILVLADAMLAYRLCK